MSSMLFFAHRPGDTLANPTSAPPGYTMTLWRPGFLRYCPDGRLRPPYVVWWLFHRSSIFSNRDYAALLVLQNARVVHRSMIFPRFFRFPFMGKDDLQIGDTWTAEDHRGRHLATSAIHAAVALLHREGRTFWYLVQETNTPSIRVIEKAGFTLVGRGAKVPRAGLMLLGAYRLVP